MRSVAFPRFAVLAGLAVVLALAASSAPAATKVTPQELQDPVPVAPKGITQLLAPYAMHSADLRDNSGANLNAKRFWLENWTDGDQQIAWNISTAQGGDYRVIFLVNCARGTQITATAGESQIVFTAPASGWQRAEAEYPLRDVLPPGPHEQSHKRFDVRGRERKSPVL